MSFEARSLCARLIDPRRPEHAGLVAVATGALTLVDPAKRGPVGRAALRAANAALVGFVAWAELHDPDSTLREAGDRLVMRAAARSALRAEDAPSSFSVFASEDRPPTFGLTAAAVGASLGFAGLEEALDARLHRAAERLGARRPRLVLAAAAAGLTLIGALGRGPAAEVEADWVDDGHDEPVDLPAEVRALIAAMLEQTDGWGAAELRAQLAVAQGASWTAADAADGAPDVDIVVPGEPPRAVPGTAEFPVRGVIRPEGDDEFDVVLWVRGGVLSELLLRRRTETDEFDGYTWPAGEPAWPSPDDVEWVEETEDGTRPTAR